MPPRHTFELRVIPFGDADLGVELFDQVLDNGPSRRIVRSSGAKLQGVTDHLLEALRQSGYRPSDLKRNRRKPFELPEQVGVRLGLALISTKPLSKIRRVEEVSTAVRGMSEDEAYYWYAKCTDAEHGHRAQKAFRDLWSDR